MSTSAQNIFILRKRTRMFLRRNSWAKNRRPPTTHHPPTATLSLSRRRRKTMPDAPIVAYPAGRRSSTCQPRRTISRGDLRIMVKIGPVTYHGHRRGSEGGFGRRRGGDGLSAFLEGQKKHAWTPCHFCPSKKALSWSTVMSQVHRAPPLTNFFMSQFKQDPMPTRERVRRSYPTQKNFM